VAYLEALKTNLEKFVMNNEYKVGGNDRAIISLFLTLTFGKISQYSRLEKCILSS
jgi:hypothetical protein